MLALGYLLAVCAVAAFAAPNPDQDGKWRPDKFGDDGRYADAGRYRRPKDEGKYVHIPNPYIHIDNPYDGGYGPYSHLDDPYKHSESRDQYAYVPPKDVVIYKPGYYKNDGDKILSQIHNHGSDKYDFGFVNENEIRAKESAVIKKLGPDDEGTASAGSYEYIGPDGFKYRVTYTADENGFRPKLERLPTPYSGKWVKLPRDDYSSLRNVEVDNNNL